MEPQRSRRPIGRAADLEKVVDEHGAVRDDAVVADRHQVADKRVRLDFAALADDRAALDLHKGTDEVPSPIVQP